MLLDLIPAGDVQQGLFDSPAYARSTVIMATIDAINRDHGRGTIALADVGRTQAWALSRAMRGPRLRPAGKSC